LENFTVPFKYLDYIPLYRFLSIATYRVGRTTSVIIVENNNPNMMTKANGL